VLRWGWNTTCYQIVNPGIERWFAPGGDAVVGFVRRRGVRVVAGAPVCPPERLADVVAEFEALEPSRVCYFGAEGRMRTIIGDRLDYATVALGAQPVWSLRGWMERFDADRSLRMQRNRARNKGLTVEEWPAERANDHPELRRCLGEWLETRGLPPLHFLVEPETLRCLEGRRVFVALRRDRVVGFTVFSPVPERRGWLTEQFVRGHGAPNGTVELLLDTAVRRTHAEGSRYVTMGIVPLSDHGRAAAAHNPPWLRFLMAWTRAHGKRFYNFGGLDRFKSKFHPEEWEPIYAISKEPVFSFSTLYAVAGAFTKEPPWLAVATGLGKAVLQELRGKSVH